jgi:hypothetical protein
MDAIEEGMPPPNWVRSTRAGPGEVMIVGEEGPGAEERRRAGFWAVS